MNTEAMLDDEVSAPASATAIAEQAPSSSSAAALSDGRPVRRPLIRRVVLGTLFLVVAVGIVLGSGLGTLSSFGWESIATICPLGALESMLAAKLLIPQALAFLLVVVAVGILLGKVFCSWVCPVPPLRRIFDVVARKTSTIRTGRSRKADGEVTTSLSVAKPLSRREQRALKAACSSSSADSAAGAGTPSACASCVSGCASASRPVLDSRHVVLGGSLLSAAIFGFHVFCLVCPIGLTFASIIALVQLFGTQTLSWGLVLFPLFLILELTVLRTWCSRFCPMGALMSLFAKPNRAFRPKVDESKCLRSKGVNCQVCSGVCPEGLDPHGDAAMHECSKCRDCAVNCPAGAITLPMR